MFSTHHSRIAQSLIVAGLLAALTACAIAPPRTDDPLQRFNRKMFAFNRVADRVAIRPVAKAYVKVTSDKTRILIDNFFANLRSPITIINDVLQGRPGPALETAGRFVVNTTVGVLGFFDPATDMKLLPYSTDFGVTLAHWGVPEGPYLVLPFVGPSTLRSVWSLPVDSYFDPLSWYVSDHSFRWHAQYAPSLFYVVTLRADALPLDPVLDAAYDPYAFLRDAYRQHRLYEIYYGNPPLSAIEELRGPGAGNNGNIDQLLQQQQTYEKAHGLNDNGMPASAGSSAQPAASSSTATPARATSTNSALPAPATSVATPAAAGKRCPGKRCQGQFSETDPEIGLCKTDPTPGYPVSPRR